MDDDRPIIIIILLALIGFTFFLWKATEKEICVQPVSPKEFVSEIPQGWTCDQWQSVIDCINEPGNGGDWSCDSCYITKAMEYNIKIDTTILNYY